MKYSLYISRNHWEPQLLKQFETIEQATHGLEETVNREIDTYSPKPKVYRTKCSGLLIEVVRLIYHTDEAGVVEDQLWLEHVE